MGQITSLIEAVVRLDTLDEEKTNHASEPWTGNSKVILALEPSSGGLPKGVEDLGLKYFLGVTVAKEFLEGWMSNQGKVPVTAERTARLIEYAITDA